MKFHAAGIAPLLVAVPIGVSAARNGLSVTENDIEFDVAYFDDGRIRPYRVVFWDENVRNLYDFDSSGIVQILRIGTERYRVLYTSNGDIERVAFKSSDRRALTGVQYKDEENTDMHAAHEAELTDHRRRLYSCDDCEETWDVVCHAGVLSVCNLVGYGSTFTTEARDAIEFMCSTFGDACYGSVGDEACEGQCVGDDNDDDDNDDDGGDDDYSGARGVNACLDPTSDQYKCEFQLRNPTMRLDGCGLVDVDVPHLPGCFEAFGKSNVVFLNFGYNLEPSLNEITTFPENTFAGLTELLDLNLGLIGLTSLPEGLFRGLPKMRSLALYHNNLSTLPDGIFSGLASVKYIYLYENNFATLPDRFFEGCSSLTILNLDENELVSLPAGMLTGMGGDLFTLLISGNELTTLPDGFFFDIPQMDALYMERNPDLQCVPAVRGAEIRYFIADPELGDIYNNGVCECTPEEAVMCQAETTCEPGADGYKCV